MSYELDIFDVRGRRIRRLTSGALGSGDTSLRWDGRDEQGRPVVPGTYLLRATTPGETVGLKVTVVR